MLRIAICDDETEAREGLLVQLEKILEEENEEVVYEFSAGAGAVSWLRRYPGEIDILFLDVEMPGMNGMETAQAIREFDRNLMLVFVTGYADYVFEGYRVNALDFLIKPVNAGRLAEVVERARQSLGRAARQMFVLKNADGAYRFALEDIRYFYSDRRKVFLVTAAGEYGFYEKLDQVEARLEGRFVRIHQRYLVNPAFVDHLNSSAVEIGGVTLPVSRAMRDAAVRQLAKAMLGGMDG